VNFSATGIQINICAITDSSYQCTCVLLTLVVDPCAG
jgi:hypothetical protein